jgi:hypothetical protein
LLFELIEDHEDDLLEALQTDIPNASPVERLEAYIRTSLTYQLLHHETTVLARYEFRNLREDQKININATRHKQHLLLEGIVSRCASEPGTRTPEDVRILCQWINVILEGFSLWHLHCPAFSLDELIKRTCRLIQRSLS